MCDPVWILELCYRFDGIMRRIKYAAVEGRGVKRTSRSINLIYAASLQSDVEFKSLLRILENPQKPAAFY